MLKAFAVLVDQVQHFLRLRLFFKALVNMNAVKMIRSLQSTICDERLRRPGLFSLKKRRLKGDMITIFKYVKGYCKGKRSKPLLVSYFLSFKSSPEKLPDLSFVLLLVLLWSCW